MELHISENNGRTIAELRTRSIAINSADDALDLIGNSGYLGADGIIIYKSSLHESFFDLKTGLAGEILQKFSNYKMSLAIVGDYENIESKSMKDFIFESNKVGRIIFPKTLDDAKLQLSRLLSL